MTTRQFNFNALLIGLYCCLFLWSAISPYSYKVWLLEMLGLFVMTCCYTYFSLKVKFSKTLNSWFFIAATLITIGAHYSFPRVPLFYYLSEFGVTGRNNFDKLGHVVQGIIPVLISWEFLLKHRIINGTQWLPILSLCVALSVSAAYEIFEWFFIIVLGNNAYTFEVLGTQGYVWDAQSDMLCAFTGALLTVIFGKNHLKKIKLQVSG